MGRCVEGGRRAQRDVTKTHLTHHIGSRMEEIEEGRDGDRGRKSEVNVEDTEGRLPWTA